MDAQEIAIDCSPIVTSPERKNSLASHLQHRPTRDDLVEKNILPLSTAHPALQAHQQELQKNMLSNTLQQKIQHRPSPDDLIKSGLLPSDPRSV